MKTKEQAAEEWYTTAIKEGRLQREKDGHSGSWDEFWMPISMGPVDAFTAGCLWTLNAVREEFGAEFADTDYFIRRSAFIKLLEEMGK
ncbi:MAG: hypothetical protein IPP74_14775 [Alphaproteobacteria bacterium]|nr:hypothetical protein [Alphaproteobacteria bacterium]